jgi:glycosyltransferase involved in cell wall biosynthesis
MLNLEQPGASLTDVSIIIPAYNSSRFIRPTIESAIAQDFPGVEVLLVDDGSSDNTVEIARDYPGVRVICRENGGDAAARNTGLRAINSKFVLFLDHDDLLHASAVRTHIAAFSDDIDMVFGSNDLIDSDGQVRGQNIVAARRFSGRDVALGTTPSFSQCMYRQSALNKIGGFRDSVGTGADHDLNLRLLGYEDRGFCHGQAVMSYRVHRGQQSHSPIRLYTALMSVIEEHLGPGGIMDDPALLIAARRHWARYFGQFIPLEIVHLLRNGRFNDALRATQLYLRDAPRSLFGTADFIGKRLAHFA